MKAMRVPRVLRAGALMLLAVGTAQACAGSVTKPLGVSQNNWLPNACPSPQVVSSPVRDPDRECSCERDVRGDSGFNYLTCLCPPQGCPRSVKEALHDLTRDCRPMLNDSGPIPQPGHGVVLRAENAELIQVTGGSGFERRSYTFDAATGQLVGVTLFVDACPMDCGGCQRVAGFTRCPGCRSCLICGDQAHSDVPLCDRPLRCDADVVSPVDERLFKQE